MLQLTMADAKRAIQSANAAHAKLRGMREKGEEAVGEVIASATSAGAGYLLGMINGAGVFKDSRIFSVPLELAAAITFHGARVLGLGGKHGAHLSNVGNAALACYTHVLGLHTGLAHWGKGGAATAGAAMGGDLADRLSQIANS
jgi:hypothetical protein